MTVGGYGAVLFGIVRMGRAIARPTKAMQPGDAPPDTGRNADVSNNSFD